MRLRSLCSVLAGLALLLAHAAALAQGTLVRFHTTQGPIDMRLLDSEAPVTVANFLAYVRSDNDRVFNYLEAAFPQYVAPSKSIAESAAGYVLRYFSATNSYLGIKDGQVHFYAPNLSSSVYALGSVAEWLSRAQTAGY